MCRLFEAARPRDAGSHGRSRARAGMPTNLALGRPSEVITISSPAAARSRNSDSLRLGGAHVRDHDLSVVPCDHTGKMRSGGRHPKDPRFEHTAGEGSRNGATAPQLPDALPGRRRSFVHLRRALARHSAPAAGQKRSARCAAGLAHELRRKGTHEVPFSPCTRPARAA
jgi:hypothetical protein